VTIGDVTFDLQPSGGVDETEAVPGRRGTDPRLPTSARARAADRLAAKKARRTSAEPADDEAIE
jgi:GTPase